MKKIAHKPFRWASVFSILMAFSVAIVLLDTFVIPRAGTPGTTKSTTAATVAATKQTTPLITSTSYKDANIQITIETVRKYDTTLYVADIQVSSIEYLKTAFAKGTYGRNIREATSTMAENNHAVFAINGDYYGFRDYGFVLRNGVLYRSNTLKSGNSEALVIDRLGNFSIVNENTTNAQSLVDSDAWQALSFGPTLINAGKITVTASSEVGSMTSNPRTAIGQVSALHYIFIVSDGRTNESAGLSLLELAQEFSARGCAVAYNLDGGGSATMWLNGQVVNRPTDGRSTVERSVSDIVYIGY